MKKLIFSLIFIGTLSHVIAQTIINGTVRDKNNHKPIPMATVRVLEENTTVQTNENGGFDLLFTGATVEIEISSIGYQTERKIVDTNTTTITISLSQQINEIDEVMVSTGYQTIPRERLTGAFSYIDNQTFNRQVGTDILSRLEATANGLVVDRGTSQFAERINIRGISTLTANMMGPLMVIDNFPYDGDMSNINPNEVESVTILKDAAAASIWGARAANGVIVITTKKGLVNQPVVVDFNANVRVGNRPNLSYIQQMASGDFIDVEKMLFEHNYYNSEINSPTRPPLSPVIELLVRREDASPSEIEQIDQLIHQLRGYDIRDDFNRYVYRRSLDQQYSLSLRGGGARMAWTASMGVDDNSGNLDESFQRYNIVLHNMFKPFAKLTLEGGIRYTHRNSAEGRLGYGEIGMLNQYIYPYARLADDNGFPLPLDIDVRTLWADSFANGGLLDWKYYPLEDFTHVSNRTSVDDILLNLGVNYKILSGLAIDFRYLFERQNTGHEVQRDEESYFARNLVNRFSQIDDQGNVVFVVPKGGVLDRSHSLIQSNNLRIQANYNQNWGTHQIDGIGGWELRQSKALGSRSRLYGFNDRTLTFGEVDFTNRYPILPSGFGQFISSFSGISDNVTNFISFFANVAYTYKGHYTLSASGRRDASNLFGLRTNDQWNPFWSIGLSWVISEEPFFSRASNSYLRLRATHGFSGNISPSMVAVTTINYLSTNNFTQSPTANINNHYNSELRWEKSRMTNLAVDYRLANNRISGSVDFFLKVGKDLFGPEVLDYTTGLVSTIKNAANISGKGLDIQLATHNVRGKRFNWSSQLNFSIAQDKIEDYHLTNMRGSSFVGSFSSIPISGVSGKPVYSIYSYRWAGLDPKTGEPRGYLDGEVSHNYAQLTGANTLLEDLVYHGAANPTIFGSLGNSLYYGNLSLDFALVYKFGHYFRRASINYQDLFGNWAGHSDFAERWRQPGDEAKTDVPALVYPTAANKNNFYAGSEVLVERADHVRLQYINLAYDFTRLTSDHLPFRNGTIYINASNLGVVWRANDRKIDPDHYFGRNKTLPPVLYTLGVRAKF